MGMSLAYMRRTRWEARIYAVEMGKVLAELLGGTTGGGPGAPRSRRGDAETRGKGERVSGAKVLGSMGVKVNGPKKPKGG